MSDYYDYLKWRGDLSFQVSPFCEIDAMIFSELVYIVMNGKVSPEFVSGGMTVADVCRWHVRKGEPKNDLDKNRFRLAQALREAPRFSGLEICGYEDDTDVKAGKQFAAVTYILGKGLYFTAFRGTDATLVGWKENMDLAYHDETPSQKAAVSYMNRAAKALKGKFFVGGHSKGGNLAVYSAAFSYKRTCKRILDIYNFDGPGFNDRVLENDRFNEIKDRVHTFVPQNSIIGMLLKHREPYIVIKSTKSSGIGEHQMNTWEVGPGEIERIPDLGSVSRVVNDNIDEWISSMTYEEKEQFIDVIFDLVDDYSNVDDLLSAKTIPAILKKYAALNDESKQKVSQVMGTLGTTVAGNIKGFFQDKEDNILGKIGAIKDNLIG